MSGYPTVDKVSMIKKLIIDMLDNDEMLMCAMIKERSGSRLFKLRFKDEKDPESATSVGEATLNSDVHFKRISQKQFKRVIKRVDEHNGRNSDSNITGYPSSRTRSKTELPRGGLFSEHSMEPFHQGVASPEPCIDSSNSVCEEQPSVEPNSPTPMHADVNTVAEIPLHRVDSLPDFNLQVANIAHSPEFRTELVTFPEIPETPPAIDAAFNDVVPRSPLLSDDEMDMYSDLSPILTAAINESKEQARAMLKSIRMDLKLTSKKKKKKKLKTPNT